LPTFSNNQVGAQSDPFLSPCRHTGINLAHVLSWMFVIGMAGCLLVIPITAYRLFKPLFEKDYPDEDHREEKQA